MVVDKEIKFRKKKRMIGRHKARNKWDEGSNKNEMRRVGVRIAYEIKTENEEN